MSEHSSQTDLPAVVEVSKLPPAELERAREIARQIKIEDSQAVLQYGTGAQSRIGGFADSLLAQIRSKDAGYAGDVLGDLVVRIKDLKVDSLAGKGLGAGGSFAGSLVRAVKRFLARYDRLSVQIEKIVAELEKARMNLLRDITLLDGMYARNLEFLQELDLYIAAGELKLVELREEVLPQLKSRAESSQDALEAQKLQDFQQFLARFEKKLHDLKLSRLVSIQTAPQLRLIQSNDQLLVEKIQSSLLATIPLWKNQIVIAISLFRQKKAVELQKEVSRTTNELLAKNIELLKDNSLEVARESERGIVELETLQKVNTDLISTIEETLKIHQEGREKRRLAEAELSRLEAELKARLIAAKAS
jgi:uncharacterized protein YaaN involved in tellurite resistance